MNFLRIKRLMVPLALGILALQGGCGGGGDSPPAPTLTMRSDAPGTAIGAVTFGFAFSEDVGNSFTIDDVMVSVGAKGTFTKVDATNYTLVVTPPSNSTGNIIVGVAAGAFASSQGNIASAAAASATQAFDTARPTLAMSSSAAGTATGPFTVTFTFSEDVGTSFTTDDVIISRGTVGTFTRVSAIVATLVVTPPAGTSDTINISVAAGKFADIAGNTNASSYFAAQSFDTSRGG